MTFPVPGTVDFLITEWPLTRIYNFHCEGVRNSSDSGSLSQTGIRLKGFIAYLKGTGKPGLGMGLCLWPQWTVEGAGTSEGGTHHKIENMTCRKGF